MVTATTGLSENALSLLFFWHYDNTKGDVMALGAPVQLDWAETAHLAEASARGLTLVGYLRQRLGKRDMMHSELIVLQNQVSGLRQLVETAGRSTR